MLARKKWTALSACMAGIAALLVSCSSGGTDNTPVPTATVSGTPTPMSITAFRASFGDELSVYNQAELGLVVLDTFTKSLKQNGDGTVTADPVVTAGAINVLAAYQLRSANLLSAIESVGIPSSCAAQAELFTELLESDQEWASLWTDVLYAVRDEQRYDQEAYDKLVAVGAERQSTSQKLDNLPQGSYCF